MSIGGLPNIKIDFREKRSGIIDELKKYAGALTFEISTLPTGDY
jgi:hypothetical protein